ncbi:MAG: DNA protecting protein DprA [Gammaproteobacteria bacterium RIFCSPHIGHO2_12_FULL_41_15]|nr:MAG: DNA protecting protein DprA [Gammaproteobacteria bacterium RIFCSPHIGHO2_12_FULL_41_15]
MPIDTYFPHDELRYQLALLRTPHIGPTRFQRLLTHCQTAEALFKTSGATLYQMGLPKISVQAILKPPWSVIDSDLAWLTEPHHYLLSLSHSAYPHWLKQIPHPPPLLFLKGHPAALNALSIAIVGSRHPSPTGIDIAQQMAFDLSTRGFCIASGLALGIDAAAHRGALKAQGATIAVLGNGLRSVYPKSHQQLAEQIAEERGVLLSELPLDCDPQPRYFPQRNRLISGLSVGTLVVEATLKSGSLITARLAAEQGREVFAIPGSIYNPLTRGCHALIQQGVKLVTTITDVIEELTHWLPPSIANQHLSDSVGIPAEQGQMLDTDHRKLLECIGFESTSVDQLTIRTGFSARTVSSMLFTLEWRGDIQPVTGGYLRVKR